MNSSLRILLVVTVLLSTALVAAAPGSAPGADKPQPVYPRLDAGLNRILDNGDLLVSPQSLGYRVRDGRIQVVVVTEEGARGEVELWLASSGAVDISTAGHLVQAWLRPSLLPALDALPGVLMVRRPRYLQPPPMPEAVAEPKLLAQTSEGVAVMNAPAWHSEGFTGDGIRIAVIDNGFLGYEALVDEDLPAQGRIITMTYGGTNFNSTQQGAACAEIVYDLAPDLEMLYLLAVTTEVDLVEAVTDAVDFGVDVISMSLGELYWGPGDGSGVIADALDAFHAAGGLVVVAAGNQRRAHWQGQWHDPDQDDFLNYANGLNENYLTMDGVSPYFFNATDSVSAQLVWSDWDAPLVDLDLALIEWNGISPEPTIVVWGADAQNGIPGQLPVERVQYESPLGGYYGVKIFLVSDEIGDKDIEFIMRPGLGFAMEDSVAAGSLMVPADLEDGIAVGAVDVVSPFSLDPHSSGGPTNGPGGTIDGGGIKPDLSGYANVSTVSFGPSGFGGTAPAAAHAAGGAALVWSANPGWSNDEVRSLLEQRAVDLGTPGKDNNHGHGRIFLGDPLECDPPGTPANFRVDNASPQSGESYTLFWDAVPEADSYELHEDTSPDFSDPRVFTGTDTQGTFTKTVTTDTSYYYRIRAHVDCGSSSDWSPVVQVTVLGEPPCDPPAVPQNLRSSSSNPGSGQSYVISWDAASLADSYELQEATNPGFGNAQSFTVTGLSRSFQHTVTVDTTYYYRVRALRDCGSSSGWSGTLQVVVIEDACDPPGAPSGLQPSNSMPSSGEVYSLSWSAGANADSYLIQEATDPGFGNATSATTTGTSRQYSHTVTTATTYYYRVRSQRDCGSVSGWSSTVTVIVSPGGCPPPGIPANFRVDRDVAMPGEFYRFDWDASEGADGHELQESLDEAFTNPVSFFPSGTTGSLHKNVTQPTIYYYRVRGLKDCGSVSPWSPVLTVVISDEDCARPAMPTGPAVNPGAVQSGEPYTISWQQGAETEFFELQEARNPDFTGDLWQQTVFGTEWHHSQSVAVTTTFYYRVRGVRECSSYQRKSEWSSTVTVTVTPEGGALDFVFLVGGVAHAPGAGGTQWRTALAAFNPADLPANAILTYRFDGGSVTQAIVLAPGEIKESMDVAADFFGLDSSTSGAVEVESDQPLIVTARTYNLSDDGTFGQFLPGSTLADALAAGVTGYLSQIKSNSDFRTNIGFANLGDQSAQVRIILYDGAGLQLGSPLTVTVAAGGWAQVNNAFGSAGAGDCDIGYATIEVLTPTGLVWAYASVVDRNTGDPTTVPVTTR